MECILNFHWKIEIHVGHTELLKLLRWSTEGRVPQLITSYNHKYGLSGLNQMQFCN